MIYFKSMDPEEKTEVESSQSGASLHPSSSVPPPPPPTPTLERKIGAKFMTLIDTLNGINSSPSGVDKSLKVMCYVSCEIDGCQCLIVVLDVLLN